MYFYRESPHVPTVRTLSQFLERIAPVRLAESWDNVGLLVGDDQAEVTRVMTCLTITPESASEALESQVELIVTHHPLPFHPFKRLTTDAPASKLLWNLIRGGVSVYSAHTAFDSAMEGINRLTLERLAATHIVPLRPFPCDPDQLGAGRMGEFERGLSLDQLVQRLKTNFQIERLQVVGAPDRIIRRCASACGSGGSFLETAVAAQADCLITGEASFHVCLEAAARGIVLILLGHFSSERFGMEFLAETFRAQFPGLTVWASRSESDPLRWI